MVPKSRPMSHSASPQPPQQPLGLVGPGRGGEVEVVVGAAEHRVAHRAADQRQLVPGLGEQRAQRVEHRRDPVELGAHRALDVGHPQREGRRRRARPASLEDGAVRRESRVTAGPECWFVAGRSRRRLAGGPPGATSERAGRYYSRRVPRRTTLLPALAARRLARAGRCRGGRTPRRRRPRPRRPQRAAAGDAPLSLTIDTLTPSSIPQQRQGHGSAAGSPTTPTRRGRPSTCTPSSPPTRSPPAATWPSRAPAAPRSRSATGSPCPGTFDTIPELAPGASAPYTDRIPVDGARRRRARRLLVRRACPRHQRRRPRRRRRRPRPYLPPLRPARRPRRRRSTPRWCCRSGTRCCTNPTAA